MELSTDYNESSYEPVTVIHVCSNAIVREFKIIPKNMALSFKTGHLQPDVQGLMSEAKYPVAFDCKHI